MQIAALAFIAAAALMAPGAAAPLLKFHSTQDYIQLCGVAQPGGDCREGFVAANSWVRFNSDTQLCMPDQKQSFGSREFEASVDAEEAGIRHRLAEPAPRIHQPGLCQEPGERV